MTKNIQVFLEVLRKFGVFCGWDDVSRSLMLLLMGVFAIFPFFCSLPAWEFGQSIPSIRMAWGDLGPTVSSS